MLISVILRYLSPVGGRNTGELDPRVVHGDLGRSSGGPGGIKGSLRGTQNSDQDGTYGEPRAGSTCYAQAVPPHAGTMTPCLWTRFTQTLVEVSQSSLDFSPEWVSCEWLRWRSDFRGWGSKWERKQ